jgi:Type II secretion system (T2SS), protein E, N-terminal domain
MIPDGPGLSASGRFLAFPIIVADDAGALLVRSGLVSSNALDDARARVANVGGTLGEQLVTTGAISDDDLTDFYRSRLLVPQVNPNMLARLTPKVVATIPSDMAIELRAIPVSLDGDNNLTVAMSDPSDRHAVDEIAFFTGAYIVRAVATQMQIAWCLAHYYGHVTALGHRLLHASGVESPLRAAISASQRAPRTKGLTGKVDAARHRAIAPITGPVDVVRPNSGELDLRPLAAPEAPAGTSTATPTDPDPGTPRTSPSGTLASTARVTPTTTPTPPTPIAMPAPRPTPSTSTPAAAPRITPSTSTPAAAPRPTPPTSTSAATPASTPAVSPPPSRTVTPPTPISMPATAPRPPPMSTPAATASIDYHTPIIIMVDEDEDEDEDKGEGEPPDIPATPEAAPDSPRARSVSGEIRMPVRRAASIRPPMPPDSDDDDDDDDDEPLIVIEPGEPDDITPGERKQAMRRRVVKTDPPELYARAGEVDLKSSSDRTIDADEPRIVVDEDALVTPTSLVAIQAARAADTAPPATPIDALDDADTGALIHDRIVDDESQPILLERPRATPAQFRSPSAVTPAAPEPGDNGPEDDADTGETDVVVLEARKPRQRPERRTQVGIPPAPVPVQPARAHRDTEATGIPAMIEHRDVDRTIEVRTMEVDEDATTLDGRPAPAGDHSTSDQLAAPPAPARDDDTNPHVIAPPPQPTPPRSSALQQAVIVDDEPDDGDDEPHGPRTSVMSAVELDAAIPERTAEVVPAHLSRRHIDHDPIDDGWGPPGTTIPPPLLGAIPGSEDDEDDAAPSAIPMPSADSSPLVVGPPSPSAGDASGRALVRALEDATARAIEVIRQLEHAESRDQVVELMVAHLSENHHRAGFFVTRHGGAKGVTELSLFSMTPRPAVMPFATLRLDRPSTLQDVVGTRLPYRGPMHDDASRTFLIAILGACPPEILLVPVAVRERVVGVLFGEHRQRHTFDDQLALAARAAGMALERILKSKRG